MKKDYLDSMTQTFYTEDNAQEFVKKITAYIPAEQVERKGNTVTCHASNKGESWFLTLFSYVMITRSLGMPVIGGLYEAMTLLSEDFSNKTIIDALEKHAAKSKLTQRKILNTLNEMAKPRH